MEKRQNKAGVVLQYIQIILGIIITIFYTPIILGFIGKSEYGIYNLAISITAYLSLLSLGFGSSYIRFYSRYKAKNDEKEIRKLNGLFLITFLIIGIIAFLCGLILCRYTEVLFGSGLTESEISLTKKLMFVLTINMAISFPASVFNSYVTSQEKFVFQKLVSLIRIVTSPFVTIPFLIMGYGSLAMVVVTTIISFITYGINIYYCLRKLKMKFIFKNLDLSVFKEIFIFSIFIAINQIVNQINWTADKIIIGHYQGSEEISVYAIGSTFNTMYVTFSAAISSVFVPRINKWVSEKKEGWNDKLNDLFVKVGRIQFIILLLVLTGFIFFGQYFILLWVGEGYENSYYIALLLIVPVTIAVIQNVGIEIQRAENKHQFRSIVYLIMAIINVVLSIFLCKKFGGIGAAAGTTISLLVANGLIMNIYYSKKLNIEIGRFWKSILKFIPALIMPVCFGVVIMLYIPFNNIGMFIGLILAYIVVYGVSFWFLGLNKYEKLLIKEPINKILKGRKHD